MLTPESFSKAFELASKYAWAVFVVVAFVLFVPDDVAKQLGIQQIKDDNKGYFWLALVFTGTVTVVAVFSYIEKKVLVGWLEDRRAKKKQNAKKRARLNAIALRLNSLNDRELLWVKYCLLNNVQTLSAEMDDVTAQSLLYKHIVSQGSGNMLNLPFHIPDEVWSYLQENRLQFLSKEETDDPCFAQNLEKFRKSLGRTHWMA